MRNNQNYHTTTSQDIRRVHRIQQVHTQTIRRERTVFCQKCMIAAGSIIILMLTILLGTGIKAFANSAQDSSELHLYYTSIEIEQGDTLWEIAQEYSQNTSITAEEYLDEICRLNHISDADSIHEGGNLVIPYYSYEEL